MTRIRGTPSGGVPMLAWPGLFADALMEKREHFQVTRTRDTNSGGAPFASYIEELAIIHCHQHENLECISGIAGGGMTDKVDSELQLHGRRYLHGAVYVMFLRPDQLISRNAKEFGTQTDFYMVSSPLPEHLSKRAKMSVVA